ncbi:MAG: DUF349 domain-containing protein [Bacteroidales bacterium]|nr:DUF349 domain-containing protein [Bacteroidales bacterium]
MNENDLSPVVNQEEKTEMEQVSVEQTNVEEKQSEATVTPEPEKQPEMEPETVPTAEPEKPADTPEDASKETSEDTLHPEDTFELASEFELADIEDNTEEEEDEPSEKDYSNLSREELIEKLSDLLQNEDVDAIKADVAAVKVAFHEKTKQEYENTYSTKIEDNDENEAEQVPEDLLEQRFNEVFNIYKERRGKYLEALEEQKKDNLAEKDKILEELKTLISSEEPLKAIYDKFKELQDKWKEIGAVPKADVNNLWQNYHFLVEKFFDKVKINRELRDLDIKKNLESKISLCEKAEELILEKSIMKSFKKLQEYHQEWKEIGPVPADKRDELWNRFKTATDKINTRRKEHYFQIKDQQETNYAAKVVIVEEAERLSEITPTSLKAWQNVGDQLNELLKTWKTIGPAAKDQNDKIWTKFKAILDGFYAAKKEFFVQLKDQQFNNYNLKLDLCTQAEAVKDSNAWGETTQILINLQKEWKKIGPAPKKLSDKIWKRFRGACDEFFTRKENHFSNVNQENGENLAKKQAIIEKINALEIGDDGQAALEELKKLQREWMEVGFVSRKEKDAVQAAYRQAVNAKFDALKDKGVEVREPNFRNNNRGGKANSEGHSLKDKIKTMKEEVTRLENNIGFFSNSKNADLLKAEFEKKIQAAKQEIALLEAQLKGQNEE